MKLIALSLAFLMLPGCSSTSATSNALLSSLMPSDGHSQCLNEHLAPLLDAARIREVIPASHRCEMATFARAALAGDLHGTCPRPITTVHFGRISSPALTDAIEQDGWITPAVPARIARSSSGDFVVFLPQAHARRAVSSIECTQFISSVRQAMAVHLDYANHHLHQGKKGVVR